MNEDQIIASPGGLGGGMLANPQGSVAQAVQGGLGKVGSPVPEQQGYAKNSSLALFEIANAEKQRAKEMQFENEALRARGEQMRLGAENQAMQMSQIDAQVNSALKNGQLDEATALQLLQDRNVSDATKQNIANVFYPVQATKEAGYRSMSYANDEYAPEDQMYNTTDEDKQAQIDAQSRAAGKPGIRNVNWDNGRNIDDYITTDRSRASDGMNIDERQRYRYQ
jgi:hypothetical protein